jgi:hypothetical protein
MKKALISEDIRLRQQPGQALQTRSRPKDIVCYACGEKGHKRPDCKASQAQKDAYRKKWLASKQRSPKSTQSTNEGKSAICFSASSYLQGKLLYDSGATDHVVTDPKFIHNLQKSTLMSIKAAGDEVHRVCGMGDILLQPEGKDVVTIRNVHLVPTFVCNLISGPSLDKAGAVIRTQNGLTEVYTSTGQIAFTAPLHNNQYVIRGQLITAPCPDVEGRALPASGELWHRRLGHLNVQAMNTMVQQGMVKGIRIDSSYLKPDACATCILSKHPRAPFNKVHSPACTVLECVHTDVVGPIRTATLGGAKYCLTIVDEYSSLSAVVLMSSKAEAGHALPEIMKKWQRLTGHAVKYVRSDRGGEFSSISLAEEFKKVGVSHTYTLPDTPQQNGVAERMNRTLFEKVKDSRDVKFLENSFQHGQRDHA